MNLIELDHALRKLRLSGMATVLEARLRQVDPLIRQLTLYRDLIDLKTGDPL